MWSIGIQVSVATISASSSTAVTPAGATPKVAITMRCAPRTASHRVISRSKRAVMRRCRSSLSRKECSGKCLTTSLWPLRAAANSLTSPMSSMSRRGPARAGAGGCDPADGAQVALRQLCLALGRKDFGDVEHVRKWSALGDLVLCSLQEVLADDEPVPLAGHAVRPAIEAGFLPEIVQRCPERELGGFRLDAVALTCDRGWRRP